MTVATEVPKVSATGNGSNRTFSFSPLVLYGTDELQVFTRVTATGAETERTLGTGTTNYSVTLNTSAPSTGTITFPATLGTALPSTQTITIRRKMTVEQESNFQNQGGFLPETHEDQFDKHTFVDLQQQEQLDRGLNLNTSDQLATSNAGIIVARTASQFLRWNAAADGVDAVAVATTTGSASDTAPLDVSLSAATAGSAAAFARDDHVHFLPTTVPRLATENTFTESQIWFKGSDVTSAAALVLGAGNWFDVTASNTITSITSVGAGFLVILHFDAALTLTHHATNLILFGGQNIQTVAGDEAMLYEYAAGTFRLVAYNSNIAVNRQKSVDLSKKVGFEDDFIGTIKSAISSTAGSGSGTEVATISAVGPGGRVTLKTSTADGNNAANTTTLTLATLDWRAEQGGLVMEARLQINDVSETALFVGFTDVISTTVELPVFKTSGADTLDSDADDACGVGFDVDGTTDQFWHGGVDSTVDTAATHSGSAPSDNTYVTIRVEVSSTGAVQGFINNTSIGSATASAITPSVSVTPCIMISNRSANQVQIIIDYIWVQADR